MDTINLIFDTVYKSFVNKMYEILYCVDFTQWDRYNNNIRNRKCQNLFSDNGSNLCQRSYL